MSRDYYRFTTILILALFVGIVFKQIFLFLFLASLGCLIWQQQKLTQLLAWIQNNKVEAPEVSGNLEDICIEIDKINFRHKKRKKKLGGYLQQFHQATSVLPDATIVLDDENRIQWANKAAGSLLNIHWPQDQRQRVTNLIRSPELERFLHGIQHGQQNMLDIKSPINTNIHLSLRVVPYGKRQQLFVARDITRLQQLIEVRKDFVANVSHELRTPLTVLRGFLETLITSKSFNEDQLKLSLETMNEQSLRMEHVINDLLTISRLEEADVVTTVETVIVPDMIKRIHQEAVALSAENEHEFYIESEQKLGLRGNSVEIYSAFSNLVFNAVRYTPAGGMIKVRWYHDAEGAHLSVSDNGVGIPPQSISRITERFYRVEQSRDRDRGGSGLGLSIVKHVLSRHKATLKVQSTLGKGSTFRCDFPSELVILS